MTAIVEEPLALVWNKTLKRAILAKSISEVHGFNADLIVVLREATASELEVLADCLAWSHGALIDFSSMLDAPTKAEILSAVSERDRQGVSGTVDPDPTGNPPEGPAAHEVGGHEEELPTDSARAKS